MLKEKLAKIMASPYVTTMPEMKVPVEVVAGNYGSFQAQGEGLDGHYLQKVKTLSLFIQVYLSYRCTYTATMYMCMKMYF